MYDAMDVSEYVLWHCENELNKPITNLQLQKFLYYIQGANIVINGKPLFDNKIMAWKYGPVIPDVYYWFNNNISNQIRGIHNKTDFKSEEKAVIDKVIEILIDINPWRVVDLVHEEKPWIMNKILATEITVNEIRDWFCNNWEEIWIRFQKTK